MHERGKAETEGGRKGPYSEPVLLGRRMGEEEEEDLGYDVCREGAREGWGCVLVGMNEWRRLRRRRRKEGR